MIYGSTCHIANTNLQGCCGISASFCIKKKEDYTINIIDIHSHILPGVDDGAADWEESRKMLEIAYENGIRTIIATPHFSRRIKLEYLGELAEKLGEKARQIDSGFQIYLGQEIMYFDSLAEYLKQGDALTLAGTKYVLIEFMPSVSYNNMFQWIRKIQMAGYLPVIAHVERYHVLREEKRFHELKSTGCCLQVNYSSLEGTFLDVHTRWSRNKILGNHIHFLGTDMHHSARRSPAIKKSLKWLERNTNKELQEALTSRNAENLLANRQI